MKCPFCAEQIQDEALLCRFCGAQRAGNSWRAPGQSAPPAPDAKSNFTIATTGWLLLVSGGWSLFTLTSPVALFGAVRSGPLAILYNGLFAALFSGLGYALIARKPWTLTATWITSLFYTLDKLELILDPAARDAALGDAATMLGDLGEMVQQVLVLSSLLFLVGWWSFVAYLYFKRDYFSQSSRPSAS